MASPEVVAGGGRGRWVWFVVALIAGAALWVVCTFAAAFLACDPGAPFFCEAVDPFTRLAVPGALLAAGLCVGLPMLLLPLGRTTKVVLVVVVALVGSAAASGVSNARPNGCVSSAAGYVDGC